MNTTTKINEGDKARARELFRQQARIAERFEKYMRDMDMRDYIPTMTTILMTLDFADQDCGIDFDKLENAPKSDFMHDMMGMLRHVSRETCKLTGCFLPRCAVSKKEVA